MKVHVLDANALYRFLVRGGGAEIVIRLFKEARDAEQPLRMSVVNWGEVYYTIAKSEGFAEAARVMDRVKLLPLDVLDVDQAITARAAQFKAGYGLPYADCFRRSHCRERSHCGHVGREGLQEDPWSEHTAAPGAPNKELN